MTIEKAIEKVLGLTMKDLRGDTRTKDRLYGRVLYAKFCGLSKADTGRELHKVYTTVLYYLDAYEDLMVNDEDFYIYSNQVQELVAV